MSRRSVCASHSQNYVAVGEEASESGSPGLPQLNPKPGCPAGEGGWMESPVNTTS